MIETVQLKDVKKGEFICRVNAAGVVGKKVYTRGCYDQSTKRFECNDEEDISRAIQLKGSALVLIGFTY